MKKFLLRIIFFILPLSVFLIEGFLPLNMFTYRPWEALLYVKKTGSLYPFYPNQTIKMNSVGDLCHHTQHAILKEENWVTDKLGYRNYKFEEKPDILLIGDSFIVGSSLTQDSTLTEMLKKKLKYKVYNIAPATFNDFIYLINNNIIQKPQIVIYGIVERDIPEAINLLNIKAAVSQPSNSTVFRDKITRLYFLKYIKSRLLGTNGKGVSGVNDKTMYFLKGVNQLYLNKKINEVVANIISYKSYCDSIGVDFIFLPLPNKETVYFQNVPFEVQPNYLFLLDSLLTQNNVKSINTIKLFNDFKTKGIQYCYHKDDTHWNSVGVEIVSDKIFKVLSDQ